MTGFRRNAFLAEGAAKERQARETHYPAMVARGDMTQEEADRDLADWRAIAILFDTGVVQTGPSWADLEAAAARALERREAALEARPGDPLLAERLAVASSLHSRIAWHAELFARDRAHIEKQRREAAAA